MYGVGRVWVQMLGDLGTRARVILVLGECIWNAPTVSLVLRAFDYICSLGFPPRWKVYPLGSILGDCLQFPFEEKGSLAKNHHFLFTHMFPCFPVFPLLLKPPPPPI